MKRFNFALIISIIIMIFCGITKAQQYSSEKNVVHIGWKKGKYSPNATGIAKAFTRAQFLRQPKSFMTVEFEPGTYDLGNTGILLKDSVIVEAKNCVFNSTSLNGTFTDGGLTITAYLNGNPTINNTNGDAYKIVKSANTNILNDRSAIKVTYAQLAALITANNLTAGNWYKITDYQTVHTIPNTSDVNTGAIEPLFVLAVSNNKLSPIAYSETYPKDIIYYDYNNNQTVVPGCTKGYIYRRIDTEHNNDIPFDYRNVKFRRWQINVTTEDATGAVGNYTKRAVVKKTGTNEIYIKLNDATAQPFTNTSAWKRFEWDNGQYVSPTSNQWQIGSIPFQLIIPANTSYMDYKMFTTAPTSSGVESSYSSIYNNKIEPSLSDILGYNNTIIFGSSFNNNSIGDSFSKNSIGNSFSKNSIGSSFNNNSIGDSFSYNSIGDSFNNNTIGDSFYKNSISNSSSQNLIGNGFNNNSIGDSFSNNSIGNNFYINSIGKNFSSNSIGNNFNNNTINKIACSNIDFTTATHVYNGKSKFWFTTEYGAIKLYYFDKTTFALTVANITD